ncbi:hypothetical protein OROMI_001806 [Orobanche minor]
MDSLKRCLLFVLVLLFLIQLMRAVNGNLVFKVRHKYGGRSKNKAAALGSLVEHDSRRHGGMLAAIDFPLGGNGSPTGAALYTTVTIGTPQVDYHVQVDTGSDILWVNCQNCERCPTKSDLNQYDLSASSTDCKAGTNCEYLIAYGDGSRTEGYFVRDQFRLDKVTGNLHTSTMNGSIVFGCSAKQSGDLGSSSEAVDGLIGFGQANSSIVSQLALSGKVKKIFSHCLQGNKGGGIFAIGEVVEPKVNKTPLVPNAQHYNVNLMAVEVRGQFLNLPTEILDSGSSRGTVIDSGTTLAYLPSVVYQQLMDKIMAQQPNMQTHIVEQQFRCLRYHGNIDDGFPVVKFHFEGSLMLPVFPRDYLFKISDIVLSDKLVLYDLENQTVGWAQYNWVHRASKLETKRLETLMMSAPMTYLLLSACVRLILYLSFCV